MTVSSWRKNSASFSELVLRRASVLVPGHRPSALHRAGGEEEEVEEEGDGGGTLHCRGIHRNVTHVAG